MMIQDGPNGERELQRKKILVVDDSPPTLTLMTHLLEKHYDVFTAISATDALKSLGENDFDLICLDISLPDMSGLDLCQHIKSIQNSSNKHLNKNSTIPLLLVTADDTVEMREKGHAAGANELLLKDNLKADLRLTVGRIVDADTRFRGMTVVVVDGMRTARSLVSSYLIPKGLTVIEAQDGDEAYAIIKKNLMKIDMLITSQVIAGMNGVELCRRVRKDLSMSRIPIILLSSVDNKNVVLDFFNAGGTDYLAKAFLQIELHARVYLHLENRYLINELRKRK